MSEPIDKDLMDLCKATQDGRMKKALKEKIAEVEPKRDLFYFLKRSKRTKDDGGYYYVQEPGMSICPKCKKKAYAFRLTSWLHEQSLGLNCAECGKLSAAAMWREA